MRAGGYTKGSREAERERESALRARETTKNERERLGREAAARRAEAARSDRRRSKRGLDPKDHDARGRKNRARLTGKDATAGRLLRQLEGRLRHADEALAALRVEKVRRLGIWLPGARARSDRLAALDAEAIPLGDGRTLRVPDLVVEPSDRIAITGPNGAGKSTLVRHLLAGCTAPRERVIALPQEIERAAGRAALEEARALGREELGFVMTVVSCLGSRPAPLLASCEPSPGELRKLLLALGMRRAPWLLVLDEPTNHLDLPSIECLEDALDGCPCALVLVSHDRRFLGRLARREWRIAPIGGDRGDTRLEVR
jgi:ATPase subunit of ABC transporter with duplicated ATPase domains